MYTVQKTIPALSYPPQVIRGTRFPGGGYYLFPPDTVPANVEFTGMFNLVRKMFKNKILNTFPFLFSNKLLVRIANREDPDQTASSEAV